MILKKQNAKSFFNQVQYKIFTCGKISVLVKNTQTKNGFYFDRRIPSMITFYFNRIYSVREKRYPKSMVFFIFEKERNHGRRPTLF